MLGSNKQVGPYMGVVEDSIKTFRDGRNFRVLLYGAYNAMGLIGCEHNGIAILDEDNKRVVTDRIGGIDTGYFGPSQFQRDEFARVIALDDEAFVILVNSSNAKGFYLGI